MQKNDYDLCVIGGGINGAGIARDAAGRGLSVALVEARDLASATSSSSTKLIHGGLRYLEYFEFRLVRHSLQEREKLLALAPHIIWPLRFVLPHDEEQRPFWMLRLGLFLYDHIGGRRTIEGSLALDFSVHAYGDPLQNKYDRGFVYSDCWVDDARLVVLNAMDAHKRGADVFTRTPCIKMEHKGDHWSLRLRDFDTGQERSITAKKVVNAAGPWVNGVIEESGLGAASVPKIRLVKGSHIIVKRQFEGEQAYILQQPDKRIVFAIPYEGAYTLIGTTEEEYSGAPAQAQISDAEIAYLCAAFNRSFNDQITAQDVLWSYSGVRPLFDDGEDSATSATRDYVLYHHEEFTAPLISVFGGKLTTYRVLAEQVVDRLTNARGRWSAGVPLPGGDIVDGDFEGFVLQKSQHYTFLSPDLLRRYARAYGTCMDAFLHDATCLDDLGRHIGDDIYAAEIYYMVTHEFARTAEDILWRRSKLGLHVSPETVQSLNEILPEILKRAA